MATRFRVACWEGGPAGLAVHGRLDDLRGWTRECPWPLRPVRWQDWLGRSAVGALSEAVEHFAGRGVTQTLLEDELSGRLPRPWPREVATKVRRGWQRAALARLRAPRPLWVDNRTRHRLARWRLPLFPRRLLPTVRAALRALRPLVPPRIIAALWRTWWNGWLTTRRMRTCAGWGAAAHCVFGCPRGADSVEHYARCPLIAAWALRDLALQRPELEAALGEFLLLTPPPRRDAAGGLPRRAIRTAAVYRVHCLVRHGAVPGGVAACEALRQAARDLVRGHVAAGHALDAVEWEDLQRAAAAHQAQQAAGARGPQAKAAAAPGAR